MTDSNELFKGWMALIRQDRSARYTYENRREHLEELMDMFQSNGVEIDEAATYKSKVVKALVTEEGLKGKGKHKGWRENVENDFEDIIQLTYNPLVKEQITKRKLDYKPDDEIIKWAKAKFGDGVPQPVLRDCHVIGHSLNMWFINDFYKRKIRKSK